MQTCPLVERTPFSSGNRNSPRTWGARVSGELAKKTAYPARLRPDVRRPPTASRSVWLGRPERCLGSDPPATAASPKRALMMEDVGATPTVNNAPSRGHSCTMSVSAAARNAPATRAAAAVLDVASAAMSRPPGRRHGTSAASQRSASSSCRPPTFSTTSAESAARRERQLGAARAPRPAARCCFCARRRRAHRDRAASRTRPAPARGPCWRSRHRATAARSPRPARAPPSSAAPPPVSARCPARPRARVLLTPIFLLRGATLS